MRVLPFFGYSLRMAVPPLASDVLLDTLDDLELPRCEYVLVVRESRLLSRRRRDER